MVTPPPLRRLKVRRCYNRGAFQKAIDLAWPETEHKGNRMFAIDILLRSYYNLGQWQAVLDVVAQFPEVNTDSTVNRARSKLIPHHRQEAAKPKPESLWEWNLDDLLSNWRLEDRRLWLRHPWGYVYWDMPEGFSLDTTSPALLHLALEVLLGPWVPETKRWNATRPIGQRLALSYSGGVDSTAAMLLLPDDTLLAYHERDFPSMLSHSLPHRTFEAVRERTGREVVCIPSNHEVIRTLHGKQTGFSTAHAAGAHLILLADHFDLRGIAFGTPIDNTWLKKGKTYRDFSESFYWTHWSKKFLQAGLHYVLPINHISEAGALMVCKQSPLVDVVNSCLRGDEERWCGRCWKCFHKNGPLGRSFDPTSTEIQTFLNTTPLRTAQHALWALKTQDLGHLVPHLAPFLEADLSWWEQAYRPGLALIDEQWRTGVEERTTGYLNWMEEPAPLEGVDLQV
jgi:hypothetical protein